MSWLGLPHKDQLLVLALCRFSEPLTNTGALSYLYYFLKSFDASLTPPEIARQAGFVAVSFAVGQVLTGALWGRVSDTHGRKTVIMLGLLGTACATLMFGFSRNVWMAASARLLAGLLNGNIGVLRTMIAEIVVDKKHQSRAFLILPMCFNIAISVSPVLAGVLADPTSEKSSLRWLVGSDSILGGKNGVLWLRRYPFALPNVVSASFLLTSLLLCWLFLDETLPGRGDDLGRRMGKRIFSDGKGRYTQLSTTPTDDVSLDEIPPAPTRKLTYREIFTPNVILTMLNFMISPLHNATFMQLFPIFLSTPRSTSPIKLPFQFNGGLEMSVENVGYALSVLGFVGITMQILIYPRVQGRYGLMTCYRLSVCLFPIAYILLPYLSILPSAQPVSFWASVGAVVLLQVMARTFALPSTVILLNNCAPDRSCLGFIHGVGSSLASLSRVIGPLSGAFLLARGQEIGSIGLVWWTLAGIAIFGAVFSHFIYEGPGLQAPAVKADAED